MRNEHGAVPEGRRHRGVVFVFCVASMACAGWASCGKSVGYEVGGGVPAVGEPQWAMFGATPQRNGRSAFEGPSLGQHRAVTLTEEGADDVEVDVLVEGVGPRGDVFVLVRGAGNEGHLLSLDPDGVETWRYPAGDAMAVGGLALGWEGDLYLSGMEMVPGTDLETPQVNVFFKMGTLGSIDWTWHPPESVGITIAGEYGGLVHGSDGVSYAIHPSLYDPELAFRDTSLNAYGPEGELLWQWERDLGLEPIPPALGPDGNLHVVINHDWLIEVDPEVGLYTLNASGEELRFMPFTGQQISTLTVGDDGTIYVGAYAPVGPDSPDSPSGPMVMAIDPEGSVIWTAALPIDRFSWITTTIAISADGTLRVGASAESEDEDENVRGALAAISADGELLWSVDTAGIPWGGLAVDATGAVYALTVEDDWDSTVVGVESDGQVRIIVALEGDQRGCGHFYSNFYISSVVLADGGRLYVGSADGTLHIIE